MFSENKNNLQNTFCDDQSIAPSYHEVDRSDILICGANGKVYAVRKSNGTTIWKHKINGSSLGTSVFVTDRDKVIAGSQGTTTCMDLYTGNVLWTNKMPGFGHKEVAITCNPTQFKRFIPEDTLDDSEASKQSGLSVVLASAHGKILAINGDTGSMIWKYDCPGASHITPMTIVEMCFPNSIHSMSVVYVGAGLFVCCLVMETGICIWKAKLSRSFLPVAHMTLATSWNSRLAAEAYTSFNQNPFRADHG